MSLNRRMMIGAGAASLLGGAAQAQSDNRVSGATRPNLILFFPDEMRADALACYGNPVVQSPNFDRLAREGARFQNCHVQYPVCAASRCSLLTGWPTSVRGHRDFTYLLKPNEPNMFRYLRQAGYDVYWYGKNDALAAETFKDSVTEWGQANRIENILAGDAPTGPFTMLMKSGTDRRKTPDYALVQRAIRILERREADRPFCIFLPLSQPHPPYNAPADFDTLYKPADLPALVPPGLPGKPKFHAEVRKAYHLDQVDDRTLRQVRATYYGQVSYSDWLLGELLEALERTGHTKDTAIMVSSDHGDYAGDYGLVEKWVGGLESCLTHVPLIARVPGGAPGVTGRTMVELYDIMPTFLGLAGTQARHTHFARSLLPQIHGQAGDPDRAAFSETGYNIYEPQAFEARTGGLYAPKVNLENDEPDTVSRAASIKTDRYTYISRPAGQSELYDRAHDPMEENNLIVDRSSGAVLASLQQRLLNWYIDTTGVPDPDNDPRDLPPPNRTPDFALDPGARARLLDR